MYQTCHTSVVDMNDVKSIQDKILKKGLVSFNIAVLDLVSFSTAVLGLVSFNTAVLGLVNFNTAIFRLG
jgi:hypothetical protein